MTTHLFRASSLQVRASLLTARYRPGVVVMDESRRCRAMSKRSGEQCRSYAMKGAPTCRMHGSSAGQVRAKAAARVATQAARADAERVLAHVALDRVADPLQVLAETAAEAVAFKDALAARVNALNEMRYTAPGAGTEQLRAELAVYERALDRVARLADMLAKHDFRTRQIELAEGQAAIVATAFRAALAVVGSEMLPALRAAMTQAFLEELRSSSPGAVARGELE